MSIANVVEQLELNHVGMGIRKVAQIVKYSDFTDTGADTNGDLVLDKLIPAGSFVIGTKVTVKTGFTGDTTAVLAVGAAVDGDDWSGNGTINVLAAARNLVASAFLAADGGMQAISTAAYVYVTVTGGADFTSITAGEALVEVFYLSTNVELKDDQPTEVSLNRS